jgi:hypothetical protein
VNAPMNVRQRYDVLVWLRDRPGTLQRGEWLLQHSGVTQDEARSLTAEARRKGDRTRIVLEGTDLWAQCFEVLSLGRTLEAVFWCEADAEAYAEHLLREQCVGRCHTRELWRSEKRSPYGTVAGEVETSG